MPLSITTTKLSLGYKMMQSEHDPSVERPLSIPPQSFDDILGKQVVLAELRRRFAAGDHRTGLILHGPDGIGKRALGRLYAKALLCDVDARPDPSPCGRCPICTYFPNLIGVIKFKASSLKDPSEYVQLAKMTSFDRQHVYLITEADQFETAVLAAFLETLEAGRDLATFILMCRDVYRIPSTVRSRCMSFRLRPLDLADARKLCSALLTTFGVSCGSDDIIDLIVAESLGVPGRMRQHVRELAKVNAKSFEDLRSALGLDWVDDTVAYWRRILDHGQIAWLESEVPAGITLQQAVRHMRIILENLDPRLSSSGGVAPGPRTALRSLFKDNLRELIELLRDRAAIRGVSAERLWSELVRNLDCGGV